MCLPLKTVLASLIVRISGNRNSCWSASDDRGSFLHELTASATCNPNREHMAGSSMAMTHPSTTSPSHLCACLAFLPQQAAFKPAIHFPIKPFLGWLDAMDGSSRHWSCKCRVWKPLSGSTGWRNEPPLCPSAHLTAEGTLF